MKGYVKVQIIFAYTYVRLKMFHFFNDFLVDVLQNRGF
jgi:hypothetical protein